MRVSSRNMAVNGMFVRDVIAGPFKTDLSTL